MSAIDDAITAHPKWDAYLAALAAYRAAAPDSAHSAWRRAEALMAQICADTGATRSKVTYLEGVLRTAGSLDGYDTPWHRRLIGEVVGLAEIADRLGVAPQTARNWRQRGVLPEPEGTVSGAPAWAWSTIERWAKETGRV